MDRRHRRCGLVAAAGAMALLANKVADVQGFAFSLQHKTAASTASPAAAAAVGRSRAAAASPTREVCARSSGRSRPVAATAWSSRRTRTALRCVPGQRLACPATRGGATAAEAIPPEGGGAGEGKEVLAETAQSEKLRLTAEKLKLQAEKLRLEVEKEQLILQAEKLQEKEALEGKQDALIGKLRELNGRDEELTELVKKNIKKVNADLFMRLADVAETTLDVEERNSLVSLSEDIMRAVDRVDKAKALKVSKGIK
ncbi:unnamed protein product [Ectocarpus fasciculatus]